MGGIFDYDSVLMRMLNKLASCFVMSVLWLVFSIPIITIGASTTASYYTINKVIRSERSNLWKEFWYSFKTNFRQATITWVLYIALLFAWAVDCYYTYIFYLAGVVPKLLLIVLSGFALFLMMWGLYLFPYIARFTNKLKEIFINSGMMFIQNIPWSIFLLICFFMCLVIFVIMPFMLFLLPGIYMMIQNYVLEGRFKKYMSKEDLQKEEERNKMYNDE